MFLTLILSTLASSLSCSTVRLMVVRVEFEDMVMIMIPIRTDEGKCV